MAPLCKRQVTTGDSNGEEAPTELLQSGALLVLIAIPLPLSSPPPPPQGQWLATGLC